MCRVGVVVVVVVDALYGIQYNKTTEYVYDGLLVLDA